MKEATGELNATVVIVVAIAGLSAFFFGVIWPSINANLHNTSKCSDAICETRDTDGDGLVQCTYFRTEWTIGETNSLQERLDQETLTCPYKG